MDLRIAISKAYHASVAYLYRLFDQKFSAALRLLREWVARHASCRTVNRIHSESAPLHIVELGAEWPAVSYGPESFEEYVRQHYDATTLG